MRIFTCALLILVIWATIILADGSPPAPPSPFTMQNGRDSTRLLQKNGVDTILSIDADTTNDSVKLSSKVIV